jgi:hypothetical protein
MQSAETPPRLMPGIVRLFRARWAYLHFQAILSYLYYYGVFFMIYHPNQMGLSEVQYNASKRYEYIGLSAFLSVLHPSQMGVCEHRPFWPVQSGNIALKHVVTENECLQKS